MSEVEELDWTNCYDGGWGKSICRDAYQHPAKFSKKLIERIIAFGVERGYWRKGDLLADCFGGVGLGGIIAASAGLRFIGVELEPKFVALAQQNFALHRQTWEQFGDPVPVLVQGDSRAFASIIREQVGAVGAVVTSPPFLETPGGKGTPVGGWDTQGGISKPCDSAEGYKTIFRGSTTEGQIGALPAGQVDAVVSSPPYAEAIPDRRHHEEPNWEKREAKYRQGKTLGLHSAENYGTTAGQIGQDSGPTYWSAVRDVYEQVRLALRPGGVFVLVVKSYVKAGKIVDLPEQTVRLVESLGFRLFLKVRAWLVKEKREAGLFGEEVTRKSRLSFFRRLAEKKGAPKIHFEVVLFCRKPA